MSIVQCHKRSWRGYPIAIGLRLGLVIPWGEVRFSYPLGTRQIIWCWKYYFTLSKSWSDLRNFCLTQKNTPIRSYLVQNDLSYPIQDINYCLRFTIKSVRSPTNNHRTSLNCILAVLTTKNQQIIWPMDCLFVVILIWS